MSIGAAHRVAAGQPQACPGLEIEATPFEGSLIEFFRCAERVQTRRVDQRGGVRDIQLV